MSSRYDSRIEAKIFLLTFSKFNKMTFLNFKLFWWILAIGWYVIIVVYHYLDDGCIFREETLISWTLTTKKLYGYNFLRKNVSDWDQSSPETYPGGFRSQFTGMGTQIRCPKNFSAHFIFNGVLWVNLFSIEYGWMYDCTLKLRHLYINLKRKGQLLSYFNIKALNTKRTSLQTLQRIFNLI